MTLFINLFSIDKYDIFFPLYNGQVLEDVAYLGLELYAPGHI